MNVYLIPVTKNYRVMKAYDRGIIKILLDWSFKKKLLPFTNFLSLKIHQNNSSLLKKRLVFLDHIDFIYSTFLFYSQKFAYTACANCSLTLSSFFSSIRFHLFVSLSHLFSSYHTFRSGNYERF